MGEVHQIAHALKSASQHFGATVLVEYSRKLEDLGQAENQEKLQELLTRIKNEYTQVQKALREFEKSQKNI